MALDGEDDGVAVGERVRVAVGQGTVAHDGQNDGVTVGESNIG